MVDFVHWESSSFFRSFALCGSSLLLFGCACLESPCSAVDSAQMESSLSFRSSVCCDSQLDAFGMRCLGLLPIVVDLGHVELLSSARPLTCCDSSLPFCGHAYLDSACSVLNCVYSESSLTLRNCPLFVSMFSAFGTSCLGYLMLMVELMHVD